MNTRKNKYLAIVAVCLMAFSTVFAQKNKKAATVDPSVADKYTISAKAGGVNYAEGTVTVARANKTGGQLLKGDEIQIGDRVETGSDGRIEVLLNPGSYLRVGANAAFQFSDTSLDDLKLKVDRGSALFEVFASDKFTVSVTTPRGKAVLVESGVYRIDVESDGKSTIYVTDGKANIGLAKPVKDGRMAVIGDASAKIEKFDKGNRDSLADWSRTRGKDLAKMTASLKNDTVGDALLNGFNGGRWGMYSSFGLWVFNPRFGSFCFLPFGYGWYSPYGFGYGHGIWWYDLPWYIYYQPPNPTTGSTTTRRTFRLSETVPPFQTLQQSGGGRSTTGLDPVDTSQPTRTFQVNTQTQTQSVPVYVPPPASTVVSPASTAVDKP